MKRFAALLILAGLFVGCRLPTGEVAEREEQLSTSNGMLCQCDATPDFQKAHAWGRFRYSGQNWYLKFGVNLDPGSLRVSRNTLEIDFGASDLKHIFDIYGDGIVVATWHGTDQVSKSNIVTARVSNAGEGIEINMYDPSGSAYVKFRTNDSINVIVVGYPEWIDP